METQVTSKRKRSESYIGVYLTPEDRKKVAELAERKTAENGVKHSNSDIVRLALKEYLEKNN